MGRDNGPYKLGFQNVLFAIFDHFGHRLFVVAFNDVTPVLELHAILALAAKELTHVLQRTASDVEVFFDELLHILRRGPVNSWLIVEEPLEIHLFNIESIDILTEHKVSLGNSFGEGVEHFGAVLLGIPRVTMDFLLP